jgi:type I restriction-modification system DNA methylase subunit
MIWDFLNHVRGNFSIGELFIPSLTVLYAFHKGYGIQVYNNHRLEFILNDDNLYRDLVNLIPDDKHLHVALCRFIQELNYIDRDEFNSIYVDVLKGLFDLVSSSSGREGGEFYTPLEITKLMAYIVDREECNKVFDPFCGTASIVHEMSQFGELPLFTGQEINYKTSIYARLTVEALYGHDGCIANVDSIRRWNNTFFDAVVSCPPFGVRLTQEQLHEARYATPECPCRSFEEIILTRPFYCNQVKLTVTLLHTGFCFRGNRDYVIRRELVDHNLVDTIIALPANILYGISTPCIILVCKSRRNQDEPIKFIHAEDYFQGDRRKRVFDFERFVEMIEGDECDIAKVSLSEIRRYDYNLNPSLYYKMDFDLKDGQKVVRIEELISPVEGERISATDVRDVVSINNLSRDFIEVLLNNGKSSTPSETRRNINYRLFAASDKKYLFAFSNAIDSRYGINTDGKEFVCPVDVKVYEVTDNLVTPEYLAYTLINHKAISKGRMPLSGYMMLPVVIDSLENQKELVNKEIQHYEQKVNAEREADAMRLGVKQNVSDLEHMLGSTQFRINKIISRLEKATPSSINYQHLVKSLKDNVEYMNRIIHYNNVRIDSKSFNIKEDDIAEFINNYSGAWNNYGGEYFELSIQNKLQDNVKMSFDKVLLTVMLDSMLNNAVRHGFHKRKNYTEHNTVQISLSIVEYNGLPYVLLSVANNGDPIAEGFTIEDYCSRGRYTASTGRSGLGGHHVFQIAKGHNGFLYLDSNKVWNMIVEVLLPIESTILNDIPDYENECI